MFFFSQEDITIDAARVHCKKRLVIFPFPAGMSLIKLSLAGNNYSSPPPGGVCLVTSRLGTGKPLTFFYSVGTGTNMYPVLQIFRPLLGGLCIS